MEDCTRCACPALHSRITCSTMASVTWKATGQITGVRKILVSTETPRLTPASCSSGFLPR